MRPDTLLDAFNGVDPALIERAYSAPKKRRRKLLLRSAVAALLVLAIGIGVFFGNGIIPSATFAAVYPDMAPYPQGEWLPGFDSRYDAWRASIKERMAYFGNGADLQGFFSKSASVFLSDSGEENRVFSPLNVYIALCMLAEITAGETQQEILTLLGSDSITSLREKAHAVWNANYSDDGSVTSILASSLWLDESLTYHENTLKTLAESYYASSYRLDLQSRQFKECFCDWLNDATGGLMKDEIEDLDLSAQTVMAIATTLFFQAKWQNEFREEKNKEDVFHAPSGDLNCEYMCATETYGTYYWGDRFGAVKKSLKQSGNMWFILPDEGVSMEALLQDEEALRFLTSDGAWEQKKNLKVNLSLPKFEVTSQIDLKEGLSSLGIRSCFETDADFSGVFPEGTLAFLEKIEHGATVSIDEEGVTAAAYVAMNMAGSAMPPEDEIDFVLDRPFLFVITSSDGLPLFIGTVYHPQG